MAAPIRVRWECGGISGPTESDMVLGNGTGPPKSGWNRCCATVILDRDSDVEMTLSDRMYNDG
jgi:hypothetical protein